MGLKIQTSGHFKACSLAVQIITPSMLPAHFTIDEIKNN